MKDHLKSKSGNGHKMYKYEMHLHSCGTSKCGASESSDYIEAAINAGFSGMVFTNHFFRGNTAVDRDLAWKDFVEHYKRDWLCAKEVGDKNNIDVLFGVEEHFGKGKECLIYGVTPEDIAECTDFPEMPITEISAFVREKGGFIACAHPFRVRGYITDPDGEPDISLFDAIEVYNRGNTAEDNIKAEIFAQRHNLAVISGGDVHRDTDFGHSGLIFSERARDDRTLVRLLKSGNYSLIYDDKAKNYGKKLSSYAKNEIK